MWKWTVGKLINSPQERSISTIIYWETLMHNRLENKGMILSQIFATLISWSSKTLNGSSEFWKGPSTPKFENVDTALSDDQVIQNNVTLAGSFHVSKTLNLQGSLLKGSKQRCPKWLFFRGGVAFGYVEKWSQIWHNKGGCQYTLFQNGPISVFLCLLSN